MKELSDKNRPKSLEEIFREGMEEAEMAPSDLLWSRIDRDLNIKETGYYKQRLVWYQRLAAACVVLVLFAGAYLFFDARQQQHIAAVTPQERLQEVANLPQKALSGQPRKAARPADKLAAPAENPVAGTLPQLALPQGSGPNRTPAASGELAEADHQEALVAQTNKESTAAYPAPAAGKTNEKSRIATAQQVRDNYTLVTPSIASEGRLTQGQPALANLAQAASAPDSLTPVLTWPGMGRLTSLQDSVPAARLALAVVPPVMEVTKADAGQAGSRWRFGGKYASQYFDQNIALTYKQSGMPSNSLVPGSMLPFANAGVSSYSDALEEFDKETGAGFSFNTGISAAYQLNEHLDLETGLGYTQNVAATSTSYIFNNAQIGSRYSADFNWSGGAEALKNSPVATGIPSTAFLATLSGGSTLNQTAVTKTQAFDTQYRYRLLGIPVKLSYQTNRSKSFYFASMGMLTNLLVQANILSDSDRVPDLQYTPSAGDSPFRNWHFAAVASAGKGFEIMQGLQIKAGLEATQYLTNLTVHPDYLNGKQKKPYTIGLALSSSYTFGK